MGRKVKAGKVGEGSRYITRAKAIKKLQVSLKDFRRLCILKGVYPREPPKQMLKNGKTYYHIKDINFINCDRILQKFRDIKAHLKKLDKAKTRGETLKLKRLKKAKPQYTLYHLVKERYPSFVDALRDLDDPLCLVNLISNFPGHKDFGVPRQKIETCIKLQREFNSYCIQKQCLKKVFLSIKGIYYQVEIEGQLITWIQPYQLPTNLPIDIDYKVMMTFLEFYEVLLKMTMFKLYKSVNLKYPPDIDSKIETNNFFSYKAVVQNQTESKEKIDEKFLIDEKFKNNEEVQLINMKEGNNQNAMFKNMVFFLSSEVPRYSLEFIILCMGGKVFWAGDESEVTIEDKKITHFITDRKKEQIQILKNREYIQPQWVYDSVNNQILLPIKDYQPGKSLPPHLSPFGNPKKEEYVPDRMKEIAKLKGEVIEEDSDGPIGEDVSSEEDKGININELKKKKLLMFDDHDSDEEVGDQELPESPSEDEKEEIEEESESEKSEIAEEVLPEQEIEEEEYDFEKDVLKKKKQKLKSQIEQKDLAKQLMTTKNQKFHKLIVKGNAKKQEVASKLKKKAKIVKSKKENLK